MNIACRCLFHRSARAVVVAIAAALHFAEPLGVPHGLEQYVLAIVPVVE